MIFFIAVTMLVILLGSYLNLGVWPFAALGAWWAFLLGRRYYRLRP